MQDKRKYPGELGELNGIRNSSIFRALLDERKESLQKEVNKFVKEQNLIEAYGALMRMNDIDKFIVIVEAKIEQLKKEMS